MFIRTNPGGAVNSSQPTTAEIVTNVKAGRNQVILTNLTASTNFYINLGSEAASATNFTFLLEFGKPAVVVENWCGKIMCSPTPTAAQINVAEILGSKYQSNVAP